MMIKKLNVLSTHQLKDITINMIMKTTSALSIEHTAVVSLTRLGYLAND